MLRLPNQHLCEDTVDEYVLRRLNRAELHATEMHLRTCETCRQTVEQTSDLVKILRQA
jgi:predicted anti-sigma-YlaC factor YlaD